MSKEVSNPSRKDTAEAPLTPRPTEGDFMIVMWNGKGRKGKSKSNPPQTGPAPTLYANAAATVAGIKQPTSPPNAGTRLPAITEVTVLRSGRGGHVDPHFEQDIRAWPADAITR